MKEKIYRYEQDGDYAIALKKTDGIFHVVVWRCKIVVIDVQFKIKRKALECYKIARFVYGIF